MACQAVLSLCISLPSNDRRVSDTRHDRALASLSFLRPLCIRSRGPVTGRGEPGSGAWTPARRCVSNSSN